jgi:hypothetical protein
MSKRAAVTLVLMSASVGVLSGDTVVRSSLHDFRLGPVAESLVQPWAIVGRPQG